jgi:hypothetical protein
LTHEPGGLGRIERAILDLIEDEDACEHCYAADDLARAVYQREVGAADPMDMSPRFVRCILLQVSE